LREAGVRLNVARAGKPVHLRLEPLASLRSGTGRMPVLRWLDGEGPTV
jgi:hypothetical protein